MKNRFVLKIWLLVCLTIIPYILIIFCFGIPFLIYYEQINDEIFSSETLLGISLVLFTIIGMLIYEYQELKTLLWMLRAYEQNRDQVLYYLRQKCEHQRNYNQIKRFASRYRPSLKHYMYEDLLHILENPYHSN
jgi:hypothetical protein